MPAVIVAVVVGFAIGIWIATRDFYYEQNHESVDGEAGSTTSQDVFEAFRLGVQAGVLLPNHRYVEIAGGQPALTNGGGGVKYLIDCDAEGFGLYDIVNDRWFDPLEHIAVSSTNRQLFGPTIDQRTGEWVS